ncbi:MAG: lantibiotic dehydratase [Gemmatimonadetes bacterium]|nr:lantibiotic dehydratase [Gemmatimonadota bacterium]
MPTPPSSGAQTAPLVDAGFAVLRTPLLAIDDFFDWSRRTREAVSADSAAGSADPAAPLDVMRGIVDQPAFREAIRVASVALSDEIDAWLTGSRRIDADRLLYSLVRYFARATYRCTPFGLFAGCSTVDVADRTQLRLGARAEYTRKTRIGMDHLAELSRVLGTDADCRRRVPLRTNTSAALLGGRLHYVETRYSGRVRNYELTAADPTPEILDALARARNGASFRELAEPLLAEGYADDEVEGFIAELLDAQLLVPELDPIVSGGDPGAAMAESLEAAACAPLVSAALRDVCARLRDIDAGGVGGLPDYGAAVAPLRQLQVPVDEAKILQVDLYKPAASASIGRMVVEDAVAAAELLPRIIPTYDPLAAFAARFEARYETREVPLLEALDDEVGIGMPSASADDGVMRRVTEARNRREGVLSELRCRAAYARAMEVELTDEDVERLRSSDARTVPDALAFFGAIVAASSEAVDRGEYQLVVNHVSGTSGARLLGRFAHLDEDLEGRVRAYLAAEEALRPDAVFAEIIHLPQGRVGNVIARPVLRAHELSYLGRGGAAAECQIDLADLRVSVRRGRVRLRSARLGRDVHPRLSTAHNYHGDHELPVYRFLCMLQDHMQQTTTYWTWGAQGTASFLPRVTRGRLVLSSATWNLSPRDAKQLAEAGSRSDHHAVQAWRAERGIPRFALVSDADNRLPVDFENPVSAVMFARLLKGRQSATVIESLLEPGAFCAQGPEGSFTNEVIIPLVRSALPDPGERTSAAHVPAAAGAGARPAVRAHPPGSEWLYAKLYCGRGSAEQVLRDIVAPLVWKARSELAVHGWFFLRYADPEFHIRLRFRADPRAVPRLFELVGAAAGPAIASGRLARLVFDTYLPEVERYGGPETIGVAEGVFAVDSDAALTLAAGAGGASLLRETPRDLIVLAGIDRLFADAGLSVEGRIALLERAIGQVPSATRHARSMEFRQCRPLVMRVLAADAGDAAARAVEAFLAGRSAAMRPLLTRLRELEAAGALQTPLEDVLLSLSHMWVNRTLADGVNAEPILYDRLHRAYRSIVGRARSASRA